MIKKCIEEQEIEGFCSWLLESERSAATIQKYKRTIQELKQFIGNQPLTKTLLLSFREELRKTRKAQTINVKLCAINAFLEYRKLPELKMKLLRVQHRAFVDDSRELTQAEYHRLLAAAKDKRNHRIYYVMLTICGTGIRISELKYITVEAVKEGKAEISMKGKERVILITRELKKQLLQFSKMNHIYSGFLFVSKNGKPLDRSNICHDMKKLCRRAKVEEHKVFPHNFRHLFARTFYAIEKNLSHLADILGHSSIETTRIYVATSARQCERTMERMRLVI